MRADGRVTQESKGVDGVAIDQDVLVIGGGLAGVTAALAASRAGALTRLVSSTQSTLRNASGLIDVLGYTPDGTGPLAKPTEYLDSLPDAHPYRAVGRDAIESGLGLFDEVTGDTYRGEHTSSNALVPTLAGTVKPTARYPESMAAGMVTDDRDVLLVGFERLPAFDAELVAAHLDASGLPPSYRGVTIDFPAAVAPDAKVTRFATLLDKNSIPDGPDNVRRALAERVAAQVDGESRIGVPAVLGLEHARDVFADVDGILSPDVFEVPMGPPSVPGIRLEERLYDALDEEGVLIETGNPVVGYESDGHRVERVFVDRNGSTVPYEAAAFVLATGGLVGRGIDSDQGGVSEPIFDSYVSHPADRDDWSEADAFGTHEFARFGLDIDRECRPLTEDGEPDSANLHAAGAVLGNYDYAAEKSASGVSLATGYRAGTLAGECA